MSKNFTWMFVVFTALTLSAYASDDSIADDVETNAVEEVAAVELDSAEELAAVEEVISEEVAE